MSTAALYIHIPFCEKRCSHCDFYTVAGQRHRLPEYLEELRAEAALRGAEPFWQSRQFATIYFGGGTPSLLSPQQVSGILDTCFSTFHVTEQAEITLEANPGTVTQQRLAQYRAVGVNRISLGIQSFDADELQMLDRLHSPDEAVAAALAARQAGFDNLSFDLIFALPNQTLQRWVTTLHQAVELAPAHISAYNVIIESGTRLDQQIRMGKISALSDEDERRFYEFTMDFLGQHGYDQYEISNYAKPGYESRHNVKYWDGSPYLGLGASAHSCDGKRRFWNVADLQAYLEVLRTRAVPEGGGELLTREQRIFEYVFLNLRQRRGVDLEEFRKKFRMEFDQLFDGKIARLESEGFLVRQDGCVRLSRSGIFLCDEICAQLEPGSENVSRVIQEETF